MFYTQMILFILMFVFFPVRFGFAVEIIAVVGDSMISDVDLDKRVKNLAIMNNVEINDANREEFNKIALQDLKDELIFESEAQELGVTTSPDEISRSLQVFFRYSGQNEVDLKQRFHSLGGSFASLEKQIKARLIWEKILAQKFAQLSDINSANISQELNAYRNIPVEIVNLMSFLIPRKYIKDTDIDKIQSLVSGSRYDFIAQKYPHISISEDRMPVLDLDKSVRDLLLSKKSGDTVVKRSISGDVVVIRLIKRFEVKRFLLNRGTVKVFSVSGADQMCIGDFRKALHEVSPICSADSDKISVESCENAVDVFKLNGISELDPSVIKSLSEVQGGVIVDLPPEDNSVKSIVFCEEREGKQAELLKAKGRIYRERMNEHSKSLLNSLRVKYIQNAS